MELWYADEQKEVYNMKFKFIFKLKKTRLLKGITQKRLSFLSGLSQSHISELELNKQSPSLTTIEAVTNAMDMYPCDILEVVKKI